jgi:hypothetical protein
MPNNLYTYTNSNEKSCNFAAKTHMNMEDIITALLQEVENNPKAQIEDILVAKAAEYGLSEEDQKLLREAFSVVDKITEEHEKLNAIREAGGTRDAYIGQSVRQLAEKTSEGQFEKIAKAINEVAGIQVSHTEKKEG